MLQKKSNMFEFYLKLFFVVVAAHADTEDRTIFVESAVCLVNFHKEHDGKHSSKDSIWSVVTLQGPHSVPDLVLCVVRCEKVPDFSLS